MPIAESGSPADLELLAQVRRWLAADERVALVTVLQTWGSSPRPPGAWLAIRRDGAMVGSVSGGCVEQALAERYRSGELGGPFPARVDFGVDWLEANRLGLPCGGRLALMVEALSAEAPIAALLKRLEAGELVARRLCLRTGEVSLLSGVGRPDFAVDAQAVTKVLGTAWHLLLIGDGQLARNLARMARLLDYRVTICDPRDLFADPAPLADVAYCRLMPDDAVRHLGASPRSAIVTLSHDPKQDDLALSEALTSPAFYIGALGSKATAAARRERLLSLGLEPEHLDRLDAPAGIPIGSKGPAEIALSIMAGITAARNGRVDGV
ncbi:XdhC family protein [Thiorhodococcus mannitoliphagus]|uniref:XdhC family protein n=1 Tax=Thiorhodococcus mannitoliphagus TaxID=329406 RepID=A0A6P1DSR2_9GAMM|nr:XdhC family protein [Thiorhodococcus mannitoliphagus]NEX20849.1 XdhC family protein [Thiorhodococcus mannitoliphagus]